MKNKIAIINLCGTPLGLNLLKALHLKTCHGTAQMRPKGLQEKIIQNLATNSKDLVKCVVLEQVAFGFFQKQKRKFFLIIAAWSYVFYFFNKR
jgi:hypothetical protein